MDLAKTLQPRRATGLPNNPLNKLGAVNNAQPASFDTGQTLNVDVGGGGGRTSGASLQQQNTSFTGNQTPVYDLSKIIKQPQQQIFGPTPNQNYNVKPYLGGVATEMYNNTKNQSAFDNLRDDMDRYVGTKQLTLAKQTLQNYYPEYQDKVEVINQMWEDFEKNKVGGLGYTKEQFAKAYPELSGFGISEEKQKTLNAFKEHQSLYESIVDLDESKYDSLSDTGKALYDLANIVEYVGDEYRKVYAVDQTVNNAELFEKFAQKNGLPADVRAIVDKVKNSKDELSKEDETLLFNGKTYMEDNPLLYPFTQIKKGVEWLINDIQSMEDKRKQYERGEIMDRRGNSAPKSMQESEFLAGLSELGDYLTDVSNGVLATPFVGLSDIERGIHDMLPATNRSWDEGIQTLIGGVVETMAGTIRAPFTTALTAFGETPAGEKIGERMQGINTKIQNFADENWGYFQGLDEEAQERFIQNAEVLATIGIAKAVGRTNFAKKANAYITEVDSMVRNAFVRGAREANWQARIEKGLADVKPNGTVQYQPGALGRSLKAGANEFGTAIKEGASNLKANVNARVNPTPVDNMNLTDKRSIGQKINSAVKQARDNFSYQNFAEGVGATVGRGVNAVRGATNAVKGGVKTATETAMRGVQEGKSSNISSLDVYKTSLNKATLKRIQDNPYIEEMRKESLEKVDKDGMSMQDSLIRDEQVKKLGGDLLKAIEDKEIALSENSKIYKDIREINKTYNLSDVLPEIEKILREKKIKITNEGELDFSKSAYIKSEDINAIKRAYELMNDGIEVMTPDDFLNLRKKLSTLSKFDMGVSGDGASLVRNIRYELNTIAKKQIEGLAKIDDVVSKGLDELKEIKEGLFYKESTRKGELRDNYYNIIKNINNENRANMKNRLSEIMPDLEARAEAIDMLPKLLKSYNKEISEVKRAVATSVGAVVGFAIGGFLGGAIGSAISGKISGNLSRKIKQNAINKIISKQTPEKIATIQEIQKKLESKKTLSEEEKAVLDEVRKIVQQAKKEVLALPETPETPPPTVIGENGIQVRYINHPGPYPTRKGIAELDRRTETAKEQQKPKQGLGKIQKKENSEKNTGFSKKKKYNITPKGSGNAPKKGVPASSSSNSDMLLVNEKNLTPRITNSNTESTTFSRKTKNITIDGKTISHTPNKDSFKTNYTFKISESLDKYVNNFIKGINKGEGSYKIGEYNGNPIYFDFDSINWRDHFIKHGGFAPENLIETINNPSVDVVFNKKKLIFQKELPNGKRLRAIVSKNLHEISFFETNNIWKEKTNLLSNLKNNDGGRTEQTVGQTDGGLSSLKRLSGSNVKKTETDGFGKMTGRPGELYEGDNAKLSAGLGGTNPTGGGKRSVQRVNNQKAKETLQSKDFSTNPSDYTAEELEILRNYEGAGGLTKLGEDTKGALDQFYTPDQVIDKMRELVQNSKGGIIESILEPSVGTGRFIAKAPPEARKTGFEIDKVGGTIAKILNPRATIYVVDFQDVFMDFTGKTPEPYSGPKYDVVIGNPPYKARNTKQREFGEEREIDRMEDYFIKKGVDMLHKDGVLAMVVPSSFLSKPMNYAKAQILSKSELVDAYRLPEGTFPNTQVGTDIIILKKTNSIGGNLLSDNIWFEQHPEKILGTTETRTNKRGKEESYVKGDTAVLGKIQPLQKQSQPSQPLLSAIEPKTTPPAEKSGLASIAKPKRSSSKKESSSLIKGDKTDIEDKVIIKEGAKISLQMQRYQQLTDADGTIELSKANPENDIANLNYYKGKSVINDLYFAGDIYQKLEQLETDKPKISQELYEKQKAGLEEVKPKPYKIGEITFDPNNVKLLDIKTLDTIERQERTSGGKHETVVHQLTVKDAFYNYLYDLSKTRTKYREIMDYLQGRRLKKEDKSRIMEDTKFYLNSFIKNELDAETRNKIVDEYNKTYRSYVKPKYAEMPLYLKGISKTFKGKHLKIMTAQIEGINALLSKGSMIIAHGVGHGKTMEGVIATMTALERGRTKRPIFIVPGPTLNDTWIATIKDLYPEKEIVNLGGLTTAEIKRLRNDLGPDTRNWIKDGQVGIITHDGFNNKIDFYEWTKDDLLKDLRDVMSTDVGSARQAEQFNEKLDTIIATATRANAVKAGDNLNNFSSTFLRNWYERMEDMDYENFKSQFIEDAKLETESTGLSTEGIDYEGIADNLREMKPIFIEELGIDHFTVDEAHNYKNIFEKAKMEEDSIGNKDINRYGDIKGASSKAGRKMFLGTQYIQKNNANRNVFMLTATPFNNQPLEVYNMLSMVGRNRLKKLGIYNINDFFSQFANFQEDLVAKPSGADFEYKRVMKSYENVQELQRLVNEFVDYKGDSSDLVKPEKTLKKVVLKMSEPQREIQEKLEEIVSAGKESGDVIMGQGQMRLNLISPYITNYYKGPQPTPRAFVENSPKLHLAAEIIKELRASGKEDGVFIYMPFGVERHSVLKQGIAEIAGIPEQKIGIINGKISKEQKDKVAEQYRNGEINVLIGGSNTVEGIDLQNNGYITINTLLGRNPTERTQLNGRQRRQGNLRSEVLEVLPLLENSADIVMFQKAEEKEARINNIFEYQGKVFDTEEINPIEEKLALLTDPTKKAKVWENIEKRKIEHEQQNINLRIGELEKIAKAEQKGGREKRVAEKKEKLGVENVNEEIGKLTQEIEKFDIKIQDLNEKIPSVIEKYKQEALEAEKKSKKIQDYLEEMKKTFNELKHFYTKEELKNYLDKKRGKIE